jgi:hypothetical protein
MERKVLALAAAGFVLAACAKTSPPSYVQPAPIPMIEFQPTASGWATVPVQEDLDSVSNNGLGYTGEIDLYELSMPAAGRLLVSLSWDHDADFDMIVAADRLAEVRLAEGTRSNNQPEYVAIDVGVDQSLFLFVAGWEGSPGGYLLETVLLPPGMPVFDLDAPTFVEPVARNLPLTVLFNKDLDPHQDVPPTLVLLTQGHVARGIWCIEGSALTFHPMLPEAPGEEGGLLGGRVYILQFARAAQGLRAETGEYLETVRTFNVQVADGYEDEDPATPPRVTALDRSTTDPWDGTPVTITVLGALDPESLAAALYVVEPGGTEVPITTIVTFRQRPACLGSLLARLTVEPWDPLPASSLIRLKIPGSVRGISGDDIPENRLTGASPAPAGAGFSVDFRTP